jgi:hypothetical protein
VFSFLILFDDCSAAFKMKIPGIIRGPKIEIEGPVRSPPLRGFLWKGGAKQSAAKKVAAL